MAKQYMSESDLQLLVSLITGELKGKVDTETGKGLSTNDYTNEDKSKLAGIAPNATANSTDTYLLARENHTGTQSADTIVDGTANKVLTAALHTKLNALYQTVIDDNLTSTATDHALSAKQGRELKALIDAINTDLGELGAGDMLKSVYDVDDDGVVDSAANAAKLGGQLPAYYENVLTAIKVNGTVQTITDKGVDIAVPTNNNQLTNGAGYQTASQVESAITGKGYQTAAQVESAITGKGYQTAPQVAAAISAAGHLKRLKVDALPDAGEADAQTIYLVPAEKSDTGNVYDEFMVIDGAWERIGSTQVDLTGYVQEGDLTELGASKVQSIWDSAMAS